MYVWAMYYATSTLIYVHIYTTTYILRSSIYVYVYECTGCMSCIKGYIEIHIIPIIQIIHLMILQHQKSNLLTLGGAADVAYTTTHTTTCAFGYIP